MFPTAVDAMVFALERSRWLLHRFVDDLKPAEFEVQPADGANCAAWVIGHLTLTDRRQLAWLGAKDLPTLPTGFEERFQAIRTKAVHQTGMGDPAELIHRFDVHRDALIAVVREFPAERFADPVPLPRPMFGNLGEATMFMAIHVSMHAGQLSALRRVLGYPPIS